MRLRIAAAAGLLVLVVLWAPRPAPAGSCRGSGGGGSSSSSGGSDGSDDGPSCTEVSDVVGHQLCGRFGDDWSGRASLPPLSTEVGFFTRRLGTGYGASGTMEHETDTFAYRVPGRPDRGTAMGATVRLAAALPAHLYVATDLELGALVSDTPMGVEMTGVGSDGLAPSISAGETLYAGAGGVAGLRGRLGDVVLAAEMAAGARFLGLSVESRYGACIVSDTHYHVAGFVEPRVRVDYWLNPWLTVGGFAGSDLVGGSQMIGAGLGFHLRAFDRGW
jgi:hypothetical protein